MSTPASADITCPRCSRLFTLTCWSTVNVTLDPYFRERVFSGDIHRHTCPNCGQGIFIQSPLLYHDATRGFMVYFEEERPGRPITWHTKTLEDAARTFPHYQFRIVTFWDDLLEKVIIFEAGWDDTIIEMLKLVATEKVFRFGTPEYSECVVSLIGRKQGLAEQLLAFEVSLRGRGLSTLDVPFGLYSGLAKSQETRFGKSVGAGEWKMVTKAAILASCK